MRSNMPNACQTTEPPSPIPSPAPLRRDPEGHSLAPAAPFARFGDEARTSAAPTVKANTSAAPAEDEDMPEAAEALLALPLGDVSAEGAQGEKRSRRATRYHRKLKRLREQLEAMPASLGNGDTTAEGDGSDCAKRRRTTSNSPVPGPIPCAEPAYARVAILAGDPEKFAGAMATEDRCRLSRQLWKLFSPGLPPLKEKGYRVRERAEAICNSYLKRFEGKPESLVWYKLDREIGEAWGRRKHQARIGTRSPRKSKKPRCKIVSKTRFAALPPRAC